MSRSKRPGLRIASAVIATGALFVLAACSSGTGNTAPSSSSTTHGSLAGRSVTFDLNGDWGDFNFAYKSGGIQGNKISSYLYDKLVAFGPDPKTGKKTVLPYVATKWTATASKIVFTVRDDVTCSDGTKLTPTDIANSYKLIFAHSPEAASVYGGGDKTVTADDAAHTVTFDYATPNSDAIYGFADGRTGIFCPSGVANPASLATTPNGSGPYTLVSAVHGEKLVFKKRADWNWGPNGVTAKNLPDQVTLQIVQNGSTATTLLLNGQLDLAPVAGTDIQRASADKSLTHKVGTSNYSDELLFNHTSTSPTSDEKVREALSVAFDVNQWDKITNRSPSTSFLSAASACYDPKTAALMPKNGGPAKAKKILLADGYKEGANGMLEKDGKPLTINFASDTTDFLQGPDYLISQWEAAGITVNAHVTDFATYLNALRASDFDVITAQYPVDNLSPSAYIDGFLGPTPAQNGTNYPNTINQTALDAVQKARATTGDKRCAYWATAQESLLKNFNIMPIGLRNVDFFSKGIDFVANATLPDIRFMTAG